MGTSKITVISGVYMILGLYTFGFNSADESSSKLAVSVAQSVQTEQIAQTGVSLALVNMGNNASFTSLSPVSITVMGGSVTYSASLVGSETKIISTASMVSGSVTKTVRTTSYAQFNKGRWRVTRSYSQPV